MEIEPSRGARLAADSSGSATYDELREIDDLLAEDDVAIQELAEQTTYGEIVLADLIRRQLTLALSVALTFLLLLFGLPLFNLLFPELSGLPVLGLPLSWLVLAVLIYPILWLLAYYYVATSSKHEDEFTDLMR